MMGENAGILAFYFALLASLTLTLPVRRLALRVGLVDQPSTRKVHVQPTPLLGTTTPSSPRLTVTTCRSPALITQGTSEAGRNGRKRTLLQPRAAD